MKNHFANIRNSFADSCYDGDSWQVKHLIRIITTLPQDAAGMTFCYKLKSYRKFVFTLLVCFSGYICQYVLF